MSDVDGAPTSSVPSRADVKLELFLEALARGRSQTMVVQGGSMWPALRPGDVVRVTPRERPTLGDIVAVRPAGAGFFVHRVCGLRADGALLVMGDHNAKPDGWFAPAHVVGVITGVRRSGRFVPVPAALASASSGFRWRTRVSGRMRRLREWCRMVSQGRAARRGAVAP